MAEILKDVSRTFNEFLLLPNLTDERCIPANVSFKTPLVKFNRGEEPKYSIKEIKEAKKLKDLEMAKKLEKAKGKIKNQLIKIKRD